MIILYIPFLKDKAGDLSNLAQIWVNNHKNNSQEEILVIYFGDRYSQKFVKAKSNIYILGHGYENKPGQIANHSQEELATFIDMATLSMRFNYDMLSIAHLFGSIHIYCCGSNEINQQRAWVFSKNYLRSDGLPIFYYSASVFSPDEHNVRWACKDNRWFNIEEHKWQLPIKESIESVEPRLSVKLQSKLGMFNGTEKRRENYFKINKEKRLGLFMKIRNTPKKKQEVQNIEVPEASITYRD
ncbi:hypothetical protein [Legionella cardiaca]|uniref:RNA binding protein (Contains ribosomal protein S1 domain) n=1 Tax=Legionella cardiaca TaxID=1071983 RepID=A0ABY8AN41_9GAMM|nr:hypothetical protein [Legionella cardiaca]WED42108.1 hypothetical protein PXX05_09215 [Legionella cardiaca]